MIGRAWYAALRALSQVLFICLFRIRVYGRENIPDGAALLASNHQSYLDPMVVGLGLWRTVCYMARDDLFEWPLLGRLIRSANGFPVRKNAGDRAAIRQATGCLREGHLLVVFPEGTRNDSGKLLQLEGGVAVIARRAACPIVPVAIHGARDAWPKRFFIFHCAAVKVAFGPPIDVHDKPTEKVVKELELAIGDLLNKLV